jgi:hypothetical protein
MSSQEVIDFMFSRGNEAQRLNDYPTLFAHPQLDAIDAVADLEDGRSALRLPWKASTAS